MKRDLDPGEQCEPARRPQGPSQLFLLRIWPGDAPEQEDWQCMLQQTVTGETRYFKSCAELRHLLFEFVSRHSAGQFRDGRERKMD